MMSCLEKKQTLEEQKNQVIPQKEWAKAVDLSEEDILLVNRKKNSLRCWRFQFNDGNKLKAFAGKRNCGGISRC